MNGFTPALVQDETNRLNRYSVPKALLTWLRVVMLPFAAAYQDCRNTDIRGAYRDAEYLLTDIDEQEKRINQMNPERRNLNDYHLPLLC